MTYYKYFDMIASWECTEVQTLIGCPEQAVYAVEFADKYKRWEHVMYHALQLKDILSDVHNVVILHNESTNSIISYKFRKEYCTITTLYINEYQFNVEHKIELL